METVTFKGKVFTGEGSGKKYISLPWVQRQIKEKIGFSPYLGTLNLRLTGVNASRRKQLGKTEASQICPAEGYCVGLLFRASIDQTVCAVILPQVKGYPKNVLEIVASVNLREVLNLKDGDAVVVAVQV